MACYHDWIVTTDDDNNPEDVMCDRCKEVIVLFDNEAETIE